MITFEYIIFFSFIAAIIIYMLSFMERMANDHYGKLAVQAILRKASRKKQEFFFCEPILRRIVKILRHNRQARNALIFLSVGRTTLAENYLKQQGYLLEALLLKAHYFSREVIAPLESLVKQIPQNQLALAALAELYFLTDNEARGQLALDNIKLKQSSPYVRGIYWYYQTLFYLKEGDMLSASKACALAEKYFMKEKAFYAAARSYLLMGTVYRVCFVEDVASFMFRSALKIFQRLNYPAGEAAAYGNLGMLNAASENFEEAQAYFEQAREGYHLAKSPLGIAEIDNQLGLLYILTKNYAAAESCLLSASQTHQELSSTPGLALNAELWSYLAAARQNFELSLHHARQAEKLYHEIGNESAYLESLYLQAQALYHQREDTAAEGILRHIMDYARQHSTSFHIANAYSLLGLIFMRQGDFQRAKGLFQQSLEQEQKNDRWNGLVCDYANIGILELRCGQNEQAQTHLQAALDLALTLNNKEMVAYLEKELKDLKA